MDIHLTARHCELGADVRTFAQQRLEKLNRYDSQIHEVRVIVSQERKLHTAEITLKLKHREMVSREQSTHARMAIDLAADRLEQQLRRLKEKRVDKKQRGTGRANGFPQAEVPAGEDLESDLGDED